MASNLRGGFDPFRVLKLFCSCRGEGNAIFIDSYIDAYEELIKVFKILGTIFGFVTLDAKEKISTLQTYCRSQNSVQYRTVQSMLKFEVSNSLVENEAKSSGAITLLRLHRAMEFISAFLEKLQDSDHNDRLSSIAVEAYDGTLAKHHCWFVKKAVRVALYILPTRQDFMAKIGVKEDERSIQSLNKLVSELKIIFEVIETYYAKYSLLDLP